MPSTFAWYVATVTGTSATGGSQAVTVAVDDAQKQLGSVEFEMAVNVAPVATSRGTVGTGTGEIQISTNMELRTWKSTKLQSAYWAPGDTTKTLQYQDDAFDPTNTDNWRVYSVVVSVVDDGTGSGTPGQTVGGVFYSVTDIVASLSSKNYDLDVSRTENSSSIAMFWIAADTTSLQDTKIVAEGAATRKIANDHAYTASSTYYFGMYVDGDLHNTAKATSSIATATGNFTVALTHN